MELDNVNQLVQKHVLVKVMNVAPIQFVEAMKIAVAVILEKAAQLADYVLLIVQILVHQKDLNVEHNLFVEAMKIVEHVEVTKYVITMENVKMLDVQL